jgi:hypothetical protein
MKARPGALESPPDRASECRLFASSSHRYWTAKRKFHGETDWARNHVILTGSPFTRPLLVQSQLHPLKANWG